MDLGQDVNPREGQRFRLNFISFFTQITSMNLPLTTQLSQNLIAPKISSIGGGGPSDLKLTSIDSSPPPLSQSHVKTPEFLPNIPNWSKVLCALSVQFNIKWPLQMNQSPNLRGLAPLMIRYIAVNALVQNEGEAREGLPVEVSSMNFQDWCLSKKSNNLLLQASCYWFLCWNCELCINLHAIDFFAQTASYVLIFNLLLLLRCVVHMCVIVVAPSV